MFELDGIAPSAELFSPPFFSEDTFPPPLWKLLDASNGKEAINLQASSFVYSQGCKETTLYTSCILLGVFLNSSVPIFFELFVETVYPVPEGITCGVVTFLSNMFMGVLLFFLTFYHEEFSWFNWCLPGSCLLSLLLILCFRESYDRLYLDVIVSV
ncbi:Solute carrier family 49 member 4 [Varanus komodoensis]|nr:Solute carrier family 49 member 4 [Varanus komodoensis]